MSIQDFLAHKWKMEPGEGSSLYSFLSDAALAVVNLETEAERRAALAHLAHELAAHGAAAGLPAYELRGFGRLLHNELTDAAGQEVEE